MKKSLLEIVQDILSSLNFDPVGNLGDTPEADQVAICAKNVFYEWVASRDWPHLRRYGRLNNHADYNRPTMLLIPERVTRIEWLTYNKRKVTDTRDKYSAVEYLYPDQFVEHCNRRNGDQPFYELKEVSEGFSLLIRNDRAPSYWTSFDDKTVVMDSYDSAVETTLREEKTQVLLYVTPEWGWSDTFVPDLPAEVFPGYVADVKSLAFFELNEMQHGKAEVAAQRSRVRMSNQSWKAHDGFRGADYGRKGARWTGESRINRLLEK